MTAISRIYSQANASQPTGADAAHRNAVAYQIAWQKHGLIVLDPETMTDDWAKQAMINEANKRYGKRT